MKPVLLLSFLIFANLNLLNAQDYVVTPNDMTLDTSLNMSDPFDFGKIYTDINNNTAIDSDLWWNIVQVDGPTDWEVQLCVNNASGACFTWGILSNTDTALSLVKPLIIPAGGASDFNLGVRARGISGCGTFEVRVAPMNDTTNILVTGIFNYRFNVDTDCSPLVATENFEKSSVKLFPNPTSDYFTITDNPYVESIQIFNIVGKHMAITPFRNGDAINVSSLPIGLYLVRMLDDDGDVLKNGKVGKKIEAPLK